ncbi:MAG: hypothetical protein COW08_08270 [Ignavibacteriales bacterium CG12_big_fil_rev_8_21_14_0_65_30_8]|nr:MAG: hypothetical protein COW08_08270 [Ignavibacteriales bacterium CG12_big_fil_rev_8_21_14_0_65_30_8]
MKFQKLILLIFLVVLGITGLTFASDTESFTVNGLKVILKKNTSTNIISANIYLKGGAAVLTPETAGIENFALIVAQEATKNYPKDKLNSMLEMMDSKIFSNSNMDYSSLQLTCVKDNFEPSWNIFADVLLNPVFDKADVDVQRAQIISAIKQTVDNADPYLGQLSTDAFYTDHPYSISVSGTIETVSSFTPNQLKSYLANRMKTSEMLLVVVGNTNRADVEKMVQASFWKLPVGNFKNISYPEVNHQAPSIKVVKRDLPTNYIQGSFSSPSFGTKDFYTMRIASSILRDRLFQEVRTNRGLSYAPAAGSATRFSNFGFIYVTAVNPDTTIKVMRAEVEKISSEKVTDSELRNKVNVMITQYYLGNETNASQANILAAFELSGAGYTESAKYTNYMQKVTTDDILNVCKKYMNNLQFVLLGNPKTLDIDTFMF